MPHPPDGPVRLLQGDKEQTIESVEQLIQLIQSGEVTASTCVRLPGAPTWRTVQEIPALAAHLPVDPWAAWDEADEDSMKEALEDFVRSPGAGGEPDEDEPTDPGIAPRSSPPSDVPLLSPSAIHPLDEEPPASESPKPSRPAVEELPASALSPVEEPRRADAPARKPQRPPRPPRGKVIAFPPIGQGGSPPVEGTAALRPVPEPIPLHPDLEDPPRLHVPGLRAAKTPEPEQSGPRWWRVTLLGGLALMVVLAVHGYVSGTATAVFSPPGGPGAGPPPMAPVDAGTPEIAVPEPAPVQAPVEPAPSTDAYAEMGRQIRERLPDARVIIEDDDLENALTVELPRVQVDLLRARAPVTRWANRSPRKALAADFIIRYRARPGELDRELTAIGMVVGRYIQDNDLEVGRFLVEMEDADGTVRRKEIDPLLARRLYIQSESVESYLRGLAGR